MVHMQAQFLNAVMARLTKDNIDLRPLAVFYGYLVNNPLPDVTTRAGRQLLVQQMGAFFCGDNMILLAGPPGRH